MLKTLTAVFAVVIVALMAAAAASLPPAAHAQNTLAAPSGVTAVDGAQSGQVTVSWQAADDAGLFRIGWVAFDKIVAVRNANRPWLDAFAFTDVTNYGQTAHLVDGLLPGVQYAFIVGSINSRFGTAEWSDWVYLTTAEAATQCPAGAGNPPEPQVPDPTPTPTPDPNATPTPEPDSTPTPTPEPDVAVTPTPTPTPVPVGTDYDRDDNGLIEITSLAQLDAIRHDLDGDGVSAHTAGYAEAFPDAAAGMGCLRRQCRGYELLANLDFDTNGNGQIDEGDAYWDEGDGWYPIGEVRSPFQGILDGNGHTIANLYIDWTDTTHIGLFRTTGEDAVIRNRTLSQAYISGGDEKVGALVGLNGGRIANSHVSGEVTGAAEVGGMAGQNSGTISGSSSSTVTTGTNYRIGGLVGYNTGAITDSYATGDITVEVNGVGGLVGVNVGTITGSHATGNVTSEGRHIGGLVGYSAGSISTSYAIGAVTSERGRVGGLVGHSNGPITAGYATGNVTGDTGVGGLVGYMDTVWNRQRGDYVPGTIRDSYATGSVTGNRVGGLVGQTDGHSNTVTNSYAIGRITGSGGGIGSGYTNSVFNSYWDTQTTGITRSLGGGAVGKTTREMQRPTGPTGIYVGWDPEYWDFGTSRQYPVLKYDGMDVGAQRR